MSKQTPFYNPKLWNWHDIYYKSVSYTRVVTRSQTTFNRIKINDDDFEFFEDCERHEPPNLPHLMFTMKDGMYGAVPRTIVTRSTSSKLGISPGLVKTVEAYKTFYPMIHHGFVSHEHDHTTPDVPGQTADNRGAVQTFKREPDQPPIQTFKREPEEMNVDQQEEKPKSNPMESHSDPSTATSATTPPDTSSQPKSLDNLKEEE